MDLNKTNNIKVIFSFDLFHLKIYLPLQKKGITQMAGLLSHINMLFQPYRQHTASLHTKNVY